MRRATRNYILFVILLLLGLFEAVSGFILWCALPCGDGGGWRGGEWGAATFWGLSGSTWFDLHGYMAVAMLVVIVVHLVLHWKWITYMTKSYFKRKS